MNKKIEWIAFGFFVSSLICIAYFHELVFNEVQAWALAKGASWNELLFVFPHLEGHPPLWSLVLSVPAKIGVPAGWGLKTLAILIASINTWLVIFKMPFPRWVRCSIPFTYFFFYEYSVLSRPYGLMILSILLAILAFPKRNKRPMFFVGALALLASIHVFGLAISCGIALAWIWEIIQEKSFHFSVTSCKDTRLYFLGILLLIGITTALLVWPNSRAAVSSLQTTVPLWKQLLYVFLIFPADSLFTSFVQQPQALKQLQMPTLSLVGAV